jgi:plasmid stabilization system protein ParE
VKVRISAPAKSQARVISRWWRTNRPAAPKLFAQAMAAARKLLARNPELGTPFVERDGVLVRRVLLRKTRHHVYYEIDRSRGVVMILAVWGTPKGGAPPL